MGGTAPNIQQMMGSAIPPGEGGQMLTELIEIITTHMNLQDLMAMFMPGASANLGAFQRLHLPIRQFIEKHFNNGQNLTTTQVPDIARRIAVYLEDMHSETTLGLTVNHNIDLEKSLNKIDIENMEKFLQLLMGPNTEFSVNFEKWYNHYLALTLRVIDFAVEGGSDAYLQAYLQTHSARHQLQALDANFSGMLLGMLQSSLRALSGRETVTEAEVQSALVKKDISAKPNDAPTQNGKPEKSTDEASTVSEDVEQIWNSYNHSSSPSMPGASSGSETEGESPSHEEWHDHVPPTWVTIMNNDVEKQKKKKKRQNPYSDAYISGLPEKRREILSNHPPGEEMNLMASLRQAAHTVNVEPLTSFTELEKDAEDSNLQTNLKRVFATILKVDLIQTRIIDQKDIQILM